MAFGYRLAGSNDWTSAPYWASTTPADNVDLRIEEGGDDITVNVAVPGDDYKSVYFGPGYTGNFGAAGSVPSFDVDQTGTGILHYNGSGREFYHSAGTGGVVNKFIFDPANNNTRGHLSGTGTYTLIEACAGLLIIDGTVTVTTLRPLGATVILLFNSTNTVGTIEGNAGTVTLQKDFTSLIVNGTMVVKWDAKGVTGGTVAQNGGEFTWLDGNLGVYTQKGGTLDMRGAKRTGLTATSNTSTRGAKRMFPKPAYMPSLGAETTVGGGASVEQA